MTREEKIARARELRTRGMKLREIAVEMGVAISTVGQWLDDPDGSKLRARKNSYRGTCKTCGGRTDGGNGRSNAPEECRECYAQRLHDERHWTQARCVDALRRFAERHGRQPIASDFLGGGPSDEQREVFYRDGDYPHRGLVEREFGCWNAGLRAAGFEPAREFTRPYEQDPRGVLTAVCARYTAGEAAQTIADAFGISNSRIYQLLDKAGVARRTPAEANRLHRERRAVAA